MENLQDIMARMYHHSKAPTHSAFARMVGVTRAQMSRYMTGQNVPTDKVILRMAKVCNCDHYELLLKFNWCRTEPEAKQAYENLYNSLKDGFKKFGFTSALVFCLSLAPQGQDAQAFEYKQDLQHFSAKTLSHNTESNKHYAIF